MNNMQKVKDKVLFLIEHEELMYSFNKHNLSVECCSAKLSHIEDLNSILYLIEELECKS